MRGRTKAIVILITMIIIELSAVTLNKQKLRACPKCLVNEKQCPEGTKVVIKNNKNDCEDCAPGTFNNIKCSKNCECCAEGSASSDTKRPNACGLCKPGTQQDKKCKTDCNKCPECQICPGDGNKHGTKCQKGRFSVDGVKCVCAKPGQFIDDPCSPRYGNAVKITIPGTQTDVDCSTEPKCCEKGSAADEVGRKQECDPCEPGTIQPKECQTSCTKCKRGRANPETGSQSKECPCCEPGDFAAREGQSKCDECPVGKYSDSKCSKTCHCCAPGTANDITKQSSCPCCGKGSVQDKGCKTTCDLCQLGEYQDNTCQTSCKKCKCGTKCASKGCEECDCCEAGSYVDSTGASKCIKADHGYFVDAKCSCSQKCCRPNTFSDKLGSTKCKCNTPGYTTRKTCAVSEIMCEPGTQSEECDNCKKCPAGTQGVPPQTKPCPCCAPGTQSKEGAAKCICCPENTQADKKSCATKCLKCPEGQTTQGKTCQTKCVVCENCAKAQPCLDHAYRACKTGVAKNPGCTELECLSWMDQSQFDKKCDNYNQKEEKCTGFTIKQNPNNTRSEGCLLQCKLDASGYSLGVTKPGQYDQYCNKNRPVKPIEPVTSNPDPTPEELPPLNFVDNLIKKVPNMDYSIIVDKSGSMSGQRWKDAEAAIKLLAPVVTSQDENGITLYFFENSFDTYNNVKDEERVMELFKKNSPGGGTALTKVLSDALRPDTVGKSETILVVTDGIPNSRNKLEKTIIGYTKQMHNKNELLISFLQVGKSQSATDWLKGLEAKLKSGGAKYDIIDAVTTDEQKGLTIQKQIEIILTSKIPSQSNAEATFYQHCNQGGQGKHLVIGNQKLANLLNAGIKNDDISSITVAKDTKVTVYEHDNFTGKHKSFESSEDCLVDHGQNDVISSIKIEQIVKQEGSARLSAA